MESYRYHILLAFFLICHIHKVYGQNDSTAVLDLRSHNFLSTHAQLSGSWEFYYDQLLSPERLTSTQPNDYIYVPGSWQRGQKYALLGKATYRRKVIVPKDKGALMLYIPMINSASKVWINGEFRSSSGTLSEDTENYKAELTNNFVPLPDDTDTMDIVIQVANYSYFSSGLVSTPFIGKSAALLKEKNLRNGIENVFAGSLIAMFIYQFLLFFLYNRGKPNLWLALICLVVAIRSMTLNGGSFLLPNLFPDVSFETWKKLEFGGVYIAVALFPLYVHHLFESSSSKLIVRIFLITAAVLVTCVIFTKQHVYGQLLDVCHVALVLTFIYAIVTIVRAWIKKRSHDSKYIFFGVIASFPFILLEILKNTALVNFDIKFGYLVELGLLVFLIFQVYMLARHYANSYKSLEVINRELEVEITERTHELVDSNKIKDRLLSIISHDVKSPLNNLRGLISLHESTNLSQHEFNQFIKQIDSNLSSTNSMVENILFWTARQRKGEKVKIEKFDLKELVENNINQAQNIAASKSIIVNHNLSQPLHIQSDYGIINLVVRNLVANAIKFSHNGGKIEIKVEQAPDHIILAVTDQGIGMSKEQINKLFNTDRATSTKGTAAEQGTGLGLNLARDYLQEIDGKLKIHSAEGKGSSFEVTLRTKY